MLLEIELENEEELEYIENIKFKDNEVYFENFKDKSNVSVLNDWCNKGTRELFNKLIHSYKKNRVSPDCEIQAYRKND